MMNGKDWMSDRALCIAESLRKKEQRSLESLSGITAGETIGLYIGQSDWGDIYRHEELLREIATEIIKRGATPVWVTCHEGCFTKSEEKVELADKLNLMVVVRDSDPRKVKSIESWKVIRNQMLF